MRAHARGGRDRAGDRADSTAKPIGFLSHSHGTRARTSLNDHARRRQRSHDSGTIQKPLSSRRGTGRGLGEQEPFIADVFQQVGMASRIETIQFAREYGDRATTDRQCSVVCRTLDPIRATSNDNSTARRRSEVASKFESDMIAVTSRGAGAGESHPISGWTSQQLCVSTSP